MFRNVGTSELAINGKCGEDATDELYNKVRSVSEGKLSPYVWGGSLSTHFTVVLYTLAWAYHIYSSIAKALLQPRNMDESDVGAHA